MVENPKDVVGSRKAPMSAVPCPVLYEVGLGMLEGALQYARHNYRKIPIRASIYFDAAKRHLDAWWEGQDIDPGSGLSHISKMMSCLVVLRDAMMNDCWIDDRPPPHKNPDWMDEMNALAANIVARYPDPKPPFTKTYTGVREENADG